MSADHDARVKAFVNELEHFIETKFAVLESLKQRGDEAAQARRRKMLTELADDRSVLTDSVEALTWCSTVNENPIQHGDSK